MVGTPEYYAVCADVIREVCEAFGYPRFIHLGMDEEQQVEAPVLTREAYIMRGEALWWHDMNFYFSEAEKHGAQPWVWSDYYWRNSESFIKNMSRSAIQSNWFYQRFKKYPEGDLANKRIATLTEQLYRIGMSTYLDVISTEQTWYTSQLTLIELMIQQRINYSTLVMALGEGWQGL